MIYLSYRKKDRRQLSRIADVLLYQGVPLFYDDYLTDGCSADEIMSKLKEACQTGAVIFLLSENSLEPNCYQMAYEYPFVRQEGGIVIPVWIGSEPWESVKEKVLLNYPMPGSFEVIDFVEDTDAAAEKLIDTVKSVLNGKAEY